MKQLVIKASPRSKKTDTKELVSAIREKVPSADVTIVRNDDGEVDEVRVQHREVATPNTFQLQAVVENHNPEKDDSEKLRSKSLEERIAALELEVFGEGRGQRKKEQPGVETPS